MQDSVDLMDALITPSACVMRIKADIPVSALIATLQSLPAMFVVSFYLSFFNSMDIIYVYDWASFLKKKVTMECLIKGYANYIKPLVCYRKKSILIMMGNAENVQNAPMAQHVSEDIVNVRQTVLLNINPFVARMAEQ